MSFIDSLSNIAYTRLTRISVNIGSNLLVGYQIVISKHQTIEWAAD